jgi:hypothetical protein
VHRTRDQAVAFEVAQRERQHALADAVDLAVQFGEPQHAVTEQFDDEQRPLVAQAIEEVADLARSRLGGSRQWDGSLGVPRLSRCAVFHRDRS